MKVLVLGAAGFVGRAVVAACAARFGAAAVVAGVRRQPSRPFPVGVPHRILDATDPASLESAFDGVTHAVNCIAGPEGQMIAASRGIAELATRHRLKRLVHISSTAIYGELDGDVTVSDLGHNLSRYGLAKVACEEIVRAMAASGIETVILRPAIIYGPGSEQWTSRIARLLMQKRLGDLGAAGEGLCSLVYIDDVAEATATAVEISEAAGATVNLASPQPRIWSRYLTDFARTLNVRPVEISSRRLKLERTLIAYSLRAANIILRRLNRRAPEAVTPSLARLFGLRARYESSAATRLLPNGWTEYTTGLELSAQWARSVISKF